MIPLIRQLFERLSASGARTSVLHPLQWVIGLILAGLSIILIVDGPMWVIIALVVCLVLVVLTFISAYIYLLPRDLDALRSERYGLSKIALEKGLIGDNITGLLEIEDRNTRLISDNSIVDGEKKE